MSSKSTFSNSTSASYALALYELSQEKSEVDKNEDAMKNLKNLLISSKDFKETINLTWQFLIALNKGIHDCN